MQDGFSTGRKIKEYRVVHPVVIHVDGIPIILITSVIIIAAASQEIHRTAADKSSKQMVKTIMRLEKIITTSCISGGSAILYR
jgi:hypothetical protein